MVEGTHGITVLHTLHGLSSFTYLPILDRMLYTLPVSFLLMPRMPVAESCGCLAPTLNMANAHFQWTTPCNSKQPLAKHSSSTQHSTLVHGLRHRSRQMWRCGMSTPAAGLLHSCASLKLQATQLFNDLAGNCTLRCLAPVTVGLASGDPFF